jgi:hypothetical protein
MWELLYETDKIQNVWPTRAVPCLRRLVTGLPPRKPRFNTISSPCGICGGQNGTGAGVPASNSVFPCRFHSTGAPLLGKMKKTNHLHHRVAQYASGCGASVASAAGPFDTKKIMASLQEVLCRML